MKKQNAKINLKRIKADSLRLSPTDYHPQFSQAIFALELEKSMSQIRFLSKST